MAPRAHDAALAAAALAMAGAIFWHFNFGLTEYMDPLKGARAAFKRAPFTRAAPQGPRARAAARQPARDRPSQTRAASAGRTAGRSRRT